MVKPEDNLNDDDMQDDSVGKFGLNEPTGQFQDLKARLDLESEQAEDASNVLDDIPADETDSVKYRNMGWKGIDDNDHDPNDDDDDDFVAQPKEPIPEDELDMTPMVDVTFLLLIFFMVTASFTIQKSLEQAHAKTDDPAIETTEDEPETPLDYVEILIDQTNTFYVTTRSEDEVECPSDSEMRSKVRDAFANEGAERLVIVAHVESLHRKVVTAWDTGALNNAKETEFKTTEEDY